MKVDVRMVVEIPDGHDIDNIEDYLEFEFRYNCMMTHNLLDKDNVCIEVEEIY